LNTNLVFVHVCVAGCFPVIVPGRLFNLLFIYLLFIDTRYAIHCNTVTLRIAGVGKSRVTAERYVW